MGVSPKHFPAIRAILGRGINSAGGVQEALAAGGIKLSRQTVWEAIRACRAAPKGSEVTTLIGDGEAAIPSSGPFSEFLAGQVREALLQLGRIADDPEAEFGVRERAAQHRAEIAIDAQDALARSAL